MAATEGMQETCDPQCKVKCQDLTEPEALFPVATHTTIAIARAAWLAVLLQVKQPDARDVSCLIKIFHGIYQHFKELLE